MLFFCKLITHFSLITSNLFVNRRRHCSRKELSVAYNVSEMKKFDLQEKSTEVHFIPY
jgi:hypothetical protein